MNLLQGSDQSAMARLVEEKSSISTTNQLSVIRVKRKSSQPPLQNFWLEFGERPLKRALLDFDKRSLSVTSAKEESRRVFVKHLKTVTSSDDTIDVLQSFVQTGSRSSANNRGKDSCRKQKKHDQSFDKANQEQEPGVFSGKMAGFEQIRWSRRGNIEAAYDKELHGVCNLFDITSVDTEGTSENSKKQEPMSKEDEESLSKFLPLLKELVPDAAKDIESHMNSNVCQQDEFVYDLYTVGNTAEEVDDYPAQANDDYEFYDGPYDPDSDSDDSNADNYYLNSYPDEETECGYYTDESEEETEDWRFTPCL